MSTPPGTTKSGASITRLLEDDPRIARRAKRVGDKAATALAKDARLMMAAGDLVTAASLVERALAADPDDVEILDLSADIHEAIARERRRQAALRAPDRPPRKTAKPRPAATPRDDAGGVRASSWAGEPPNPSLPPPWPNRRVAWESVENVFRHFVLAETDPEPGLLRADSRIVTMGSCFAENVSLQLAARGASHVHYQRMKEDLNSTFANERLVGWAVDGPDAPDGALLESAFGAEAREAMRAQLANCEVYIFSMGVAPIVTDVEGRFVLTLGSPKKALTDRRHRYQTSGPRENADALRSLIGKVRGINPDVEIFLTLSPVPLAATFERQSAVVADCLSKSSLRLAVEDVLADHIPGVRYWPSFEMAKWWGAHLREGRAFADDGKTRHVSPWMVDTIVELFVEHYGDESLKARPAAD